MRLVSTRYKRDRRYYGQMVWQCELREGKTKEQAKGRNVPVPGSSDYLSDVMQVGKDRKECGKQENEREAMGQGPKGKERLEVSFTLR